MAAETTAHDDVTGRPPAAIGTVYGVLLNDPATVARLASSFAAPPYRSPPVAPVLYIKPRNTFAGDGCDVAVPADPGCVRIDGTIGAVIGRAATRVPASAALEHVSGYVIVSDVTLPHESYYRPAVRQRCRDGYCPIGDIVPATGFDVASATMTIAIDGAVVLERAFADVVRDLPRLIADVTEFMTLDAGDILLMGPPEGAPIARAGSFVRIEVPGLGSLSHRVVAEAVPS